MGEQMPVASRGRDGGPSGPRRIGLLLLATAVVIGTLGLVSGTSSAMQRHGAKKVTGTPGTLITSVPVTAAGVNGSAYLVKYWSESVPKNAPVMVTGLVVVPSGAPPVGGWPVVSWAHGTNGTNSSCAPSLAPSSDIPNVNSLLAQGWEVTATDYQGEGNKQLKPTKGILPYLVGESAARNTIDIVRAVQNSTTFHASSNYVVWGHSEGGQTAMFALKIASSYAPTLDLKGVEALAPPSQFDSSSPSSFIAQAEESGNWPFLFLAVGGFNAAYGNTLAPLSAILTKTGKKNLKLLKKDCLFNAGLALLNLGFTTVFNQAPGAPLPAAWQSLANQNDPGQFTAASDAPLLIVSGTTDTTVYPATTAALATELCALTPAQDVERWLYAGLDHGGIVYSGATINDLVQWTIDRFANDSSPGFYTPTGLGVNTATVTNSCG
jgi:pimeloyl-ACP methyl ester carboxylesterase